MPRRRLFVALVLESPEREWMEGVQRACGHSWPLRVPPHITVVPPVNVNEERLGAALALVRQVAATVRPVEVTIGPPDSFLPRTPVLYAQVDDTRGTVATLARRLTVEPLAPPHSRPPRRFVPHVTLARRVDRARVAAAQTALAALRIPVRFHRLTTLEQGDDQVWRPLADAQLGRRTVVGTGGVALSLDRSQRADPEMIAYLAAGGLEVGALGNAEGPDPTGAGEDPTGGFEVRPVAVEPDGGFVTARLNEHIVGVAAAGVMVINDERAAPEGGPDVRRHLEAVTGPAG